MLCVKSNSDTTELGYVKGEGVFGYSSSFYMPDY